MTKTIELIKPTKPSIRKKAYLRVRESESERDGECADDGGGGGSNGGDSHDDGGWILAEISEVLMARRWRYSNVRDDGHVTKVER